MTFDPGLFRRTRLRAVSSFRRSVAMLRVLDEEARSAERRWLAGYEAEQLLRVVLGEAENLVPLLDADQIEEVDRAARLLAGKIRDRRLSFKLADLYGRTPEEAAAFAAKAEELSNR